jgi:hypothetical protein
MADGQGSGLDETIASSACAGSAVQLPPLFYASMSISYSHA